MTLYEEPVGEPENVRMARLHSLLTKNKKDSSLPSQNKNPRRKPVVFQDPQRRAARWASRTHIDTVARRASPTPEETPSRNPRSIKPSHQLRQAEWRAAAMLQYHNKGMEIRQQRNEHSADVFPFLALPVELRRDVLFELLVTDDRLVPTWRGPRKATKQQKKMYINILLTSKQCRDEGLEVLYGENVFDFGEICNRPNNFSKPFVNRIGLHNAALIRIIFAEYSAAAEELARSDTTCIETPVHKPKPKAILTVAHLRNFFSTFNISFGDLRLFAISIVPYGFDQATGYLLSLLYPAAVQIELREKWLGVKNGPEWMGQLVNNICARESGFTRADYWADIDGWIGINFSPPSSGREWLTYNGVRGREDIRRVAKTLEDTPEGA